MVWPGLGFQKLLVGLTKNNNYRPFYNTSCHKSGTQQYTRLPHTNLTCFHGASHALKVQKSQLWHHVIKKHGTRVVCITGSTLFRSDYTKQYSRNSVYLYYLDGTRPALFPPLYFAPSLFKGSFLRPPGLWILGQSPPHIHYLLEWPTPQKLKIALPGLEFTWPWPTFLTFWSGQ